MTEPTLSIREVSIPLGDQRLAARLHQPDRAPRGTAVVAHGLYSSMQSAKLTRLCQALAGAGWLALQYDARGCGQSPGEVRLTTLSGRREEFLAAVAWLGDQAPGLSRAYLGSSMGGTAALLAADLEPPQALVCWSTPIDLVELMQGLARRPQPPDLPEMARDMARHDLEAVLARVSRVLFVHGEGDEVVPVGQARRAFALAGEPKDLLLLPGADHRLTRPADQDQAIARTLAWLAAHAAPAA
ncbi:MAG: alpha/beta hydrolase [Desulfarculus sp.]|nr:alpha/beta hydrolase [Desulfarculus sp.]